MNCNVHVQHKGYTVHLSYYVNIHVLNAYICLRSPTGSIKKKDQ